MDRSSKSQLLVSGGSLLLVFQLIVFQQAFNIVANPGVSGTLRNVFSGGLLLIATICIGSGAYLRY
ncbi:hypothetical protein DJ82_04045 [Halorubrum sp. Ib24]|nr:hypothetical protein DJ82_04045 [Halorubrum sp. Ib24]OYR45533.1 hypothetical protein DJ75_07715 [Halorubrum sp. Eb13]OYR47708.1 hypothetical protein DJ81_00500 [Halorubrum sp. Hd13]OYR51274.1 hypothetical protein DJ73_13345 [Halorubrum sp. Ea1]OYR52742.1 hypothetical protein DJ74_00665 [Halorubrum sp. Ea8]